MTTEKADGRGVSAYPDSTVSNSNFPGRLGERASLNCPLEVYVQA